MRLSSLSNLSKILFAFAVCVALACAPKAVFAQHGGGGHGGGGGSHGGGGGGFHGGGGEEASTVAAEAVPIAVAGAVLTEAAVAMRLGAAHTARGPAVPMA